MRLIVRAIPVALLLLSLINLIRPRTADTVPLYAARTGLMCQSCHFDPNGGGPRNEFGFAFARNRHSLEPEDTTSEWHDLDLTNRVGDRMPVYLGVNQRFMLLANTTVHDDSLDRAGFFNMENALHVTFQPHRRLTLVYTRDGFDESSVTRDAFGMISGFPLDGYFKAGRFRTPFGLRQDDHTVATRNSFLDFYDGKSFLPYDPRRPDMGYEIGADKNGWIGRAAFTNGGTHPLGSVNTNAQAVTAKIGHHLSWYEGGLSFYDDFHKVAGSDTALGNFADRVRHTRWGYYSLTHVGRLALIGEIAAGTDRSNLATPAGLVGRRTSLAAGYIEADYAPRRDYNMRVRFDHLELDRNPDEDVKKDNTHNRYSLEGEWVPVPFAELRWALRFIDHRGADDDDERQGFIQMHFSY